MIVAVLIISVAHINFLTSVISEDRIVETIAVEATANFTVSLLSVEYNVATPEFAVEPLSMTTSCRSQPLIGSCIAVSF